MPSAVSVSTPACSSRPTRARELICELANRPWPESIPATQYPAPKGGPPPRSTGTRSRWPRARRRTSASVGDVDRNPCAPWQARPRSRRVISFPSVALPTCPIERASRSSSSLSGTPRVFKPARSSSFVLSGKRPQAVRATGSAQTSRTRTKRPVGCANSVFACNPAIQSCRSFADRVCAPHTYVAARSASVARRPRRLRRARAGNSDSSLSSRNPPTGSHRSYSRRNSMRACAAPVVPSLPRSECHRRPSAFPLLSADSGTGSRFRM